MTKPILSLSGNIKSGEDVILKINNPDGKSGVLLIEADGKSVVIKVPPVTYYEVKHSIPDLPGKLFICNFFTRINGVVYHSNTLPLQIPNQDVDGFRITLTAKPMKATDDPAGWRQNAIVTLPIYLSESDDISVNSDGTCNLQAELISGPGPKILTQQFNCFALYNKTDRINQRAKIAHGYIVLDATNGHLNESYTFLIKKTNSTGSQAKLVSKQGENLIIDTGAAKFNLYASATKGFAIKSIDVAKEGVLSVNGGFVYMYRRHLDGSDGSDYLLSTEGAASAEIIKDGSAYAEIVITGTLLPESSKEGVLPQKYYLLLKFHTGSTEIDSELMLVNTNTSINNIPANYTIPYDGFGFKLLFAKDPDMALQQEVLLENGETAKYTFNLGDQTALVCGYKSSRWIGEYEGLTDGHYWPENQRSPGSKPSDLDFVTKGYAYYINNVPDSRHESSFNNSSLYPRGCVTRISYDSSDFAFQVGTYPEYEQPIGVTVTDLNNQLLVDLRLTDKFSRNQMGKSIPFRATIRKTFYIDLDYVASQGLQNVAVARQSPYLGIYDKLSDYNNRAFNFEWLNVDERNSVMQTIGFLKPGDNYTYSDLNRNSIWKPYFIGSNRTGGIMNWDQALIEYCFALHGFSGWLMELRLQLTFHSVLGHRQYEDNQMGKGVINPSQPGSNLWNIDIEHEDHKGYHAGICLFGNPLDVLALSRMSYETLTENVGNTLWIRAIGNQIGRNIEEQSVLRSLLRTQYMPGKNTPIEDEILPTMLHYMEDFFARRVDPNDPFNTSGWMSEPEEFPFFRDDPEKIDWPVADMGLPTRYLTVKKAARVKMIDEFHLTKGLASFRDFMLNLNDFPIAYKDRMATILEIGGQRQKQRSMTFAQYYSFLYPFCTNFVSSCPSYTHMAPWERIKLQKKYYPADMTICDPRLADEENTWGGYDYMDAYADAAEMYLSLNDNMSAFYMLRAALNHMAMNRWDKRPSNPCDIPPDNKNNDFWWGTQYSSYNRIWILIKKYFLDKFTHSYPMLFPTEITYEVA